MKSTPLRIAEWRQIVAPYEKPSVWRSTWQLVDTIVPYVALWALMYWSLSVSYWLTAALAVVASALLVRIFIIFHDCGHGSFFRSGLANSITGFVTGLLTFTPYYHWRWEHALHHATSSNLNERGTGDIWTLTVREYLAAPRWQRAAYRFLRNPVALLTIEPLFLFMIWQRFPAHKARPRERNSTAWMNLAVLLMVIGMSAIFTLKVYLILQLFIMLLAGAAGVWLFYVQHQFEDTYWEPKEKWDYTVAALRGSSFYQLPRVLQWCSGNIGFHHVHHLSFKIPNYYLERCHHSHPLFRDVKPLTLIPSFKALTLTLWDEEQRKLVGFGHLRHRKHAAATPK